MKRYGISLVLIEGGSQDANLDAVRGKAPADVWKKVARRFLSEGKIAGEEYLNLTSDIPMQTIGIERQDLYDESIRTYAELAAARKKSLSALYGLRTAIGRIKNRMYPRELADYETGKSASSEGPRSGYQALVRIARESGVSFESYAAVQQLEDVLKLENRIDFGAADIERVQLTEKIIRYKSKAFFERYVQSRASAESGEASRYAFWHGILAAANAAGIHTSAYPELTHYGAYLEAFQSLDPSKLLTELDGLENDLYAKKLLTDDARKLRAIDRFTSLLYDAYSIRISSGDYSILAANKEQFETDSILAFVNRLLLDLGYAEDLVVEEPEIDRARPLFEKFYRLVHERDEAFIQNSISAMERTGSKAAFLIAGGYHTEHLVQMLADKGYSYVVLAPIVTESTDTENYEKVLLGKQKKAKPHSTVSEMLRPARVIETRTADAAADSRLDELIHAAQKLDSTLNLLPEEAVRSVFQPELLVGSRGASALDVVRHTQDEINQISVRSVLGHALLSDLEAVHRHVGLLTGYLRDYGIGEMRTETLRSLSAQIHENFLVLKAMKSKGEYSDPLTFFRKLSESFRELTHFLNTDLVENLELGAGTDAYRLDRSSLWEVAEEGIDICEAQIQFITGEPQFETVELMPFLEQIRASVLEKLRAVEIDYTIFFFFSTL